MSRLSITNLCPRGIRSALWPRLTAAGLLLAASSCSSVSQYVQNAFEQDAATTAKSDKPARDSEVKHAYTATPKKDQTKVQPLAHVEAAKPDSAAAKPVPEKSTNTAQPFPERPAAASSTAKPLPLISAGDNPFASAEIQQVSAAVVVTDSSSQAICPPIQHDAVQRTVLDDPFACPPGPDAPTCPPSAPCAARPFPMPEVVGDEYVCDGGDNHLPVHYEGRARAGLDTEDTVAEYVDDEGTSHVKASSKVCIYSPRFGAVRSATLPQEDFTIGRAVGHHDGEPSWGFETRTKADEQLQSDEARGMLMRSRASGMEAKTAEDAVQQAVAAEHHLKIAGAQEQFQFFRSGQFEKLTKAVIELGIDAALEWSGGRQPVVVAQDETGLIVQGRVLAQDYTGVEDRRRPGDLTVIKLADKTSAHPGDVVTFTIRVENTGDRELLRVQVVDNLSPRLEYIPGSVDSNLDGQVTPEPNGAGGTLVTFQFDQLPGRTHGHVSFQCRVR